MTRPFRVIPGTRRFTTSLTHDYYDHRAADRDVNCVFPLERLRELAARGKSGRVAPRHIDRMGHILGDQEQRLVTETAPAIAHLLLNADNSIRETLGDNSRGVAWLSETP